MNELELLKIFSKNLKQIMKEENITQEELAKEIGVGQPMISRYIRGECIPSLLTTVNIADALFCSVNDLLEEN